MRFGVIQQGDCLKLMGRLPDKSIDLILCDLPYGTSACSWDSVLPLDLLWEKYSRIIKDCGAVVLFGSEPFSSKLRISNLNMYKYDWKWEKPSGANFLNFKYQPSKVYEDIMVFGKKATSYSKRGTMIYHPQMYEGKPYTQMSGKQKLQYGNSTVRTPIEQVITVNSGERYPRAIIKFALDKDKLHPTQKPIALLEYLIKTYTSEGGVVLDSCMGSGSTCIAAINTDRRYIGFELNQEYFNIAEKRIKEAEDKMYKGVFI